MSKYIIFLGGSGARCAEAFCHICMSGIVIDESEPINILLGDADDQNGNTRTAFNLYEQYQLLQDYLDVENKKISLAKQKLKVSNWIIGTGLFEQQENGKLRNPQLSTLNETQNPADQENSDFLMKALYTPSEMTNSISSIGFFARPNVGAAILRASILRDDDVASQTNEFTNAYGAFCADIINDLSSGVEVQVMLVGSLFGGTGAACIPGIAEDISVRANNLQSAGRGRLIIGTTMLLPYFMFQQSASAESASIDAAGFQAASKTSLDYYAEQNTPFCKTYLLGLSVKPGVATTVRGGAEQRNQAMIIEWEAAMACISFFDIRNDTSEVFYKGCTIDEDSGQLLLGWSSFSHPDANRYLGNMIRFSFFYQYYLRNQIVLMQRGKEKKTNYFLKYFEAFYTESGNVNASDRITATRLLGAMDQLTERYLRWVSESVFNPRIRQTMLDQEQYREILARGEGAMSKKNALKFIVTDGSKHADFSDIRSALDFASFGMPNTHSATIGHLFQGIYHACDR